MGQASEELKRVIPILNDNPKARDMMAALPKVMEFDLKGEEKPFYVVVSGGQLRLRTASRKEPDIAISGDAGEVARIVRREREITHPVAEGKVWVSKGKLSQMIILDRVLEFQRRK